MGTNDHTEENYGCEKCWPALADAAWEASRTLSRDAEFIDESHFHTMLRSCRACSQRFVSVFTETIDWVDGEDPQHWILVPVTAAEAARLKGRGSLISEQDLNSLPSNRRSLHRDFPKGGSPQSSWSKGITVYAHD